MTLSYYLAIDPGETSGWATFDEQGNGTGMDSVFGKQALYALLKDKAPSVLIVEQYRVYESKAQAHTGSTVPTIRIIGAIEYWANEHSVPITFQQATIKTVGYAWSGLSVPKKHSLSHATDAYVHGYYYLVRSKIIKLKPL